MCLFVCLCCCPEMNSIKISQIFPFRSTLLPFFQCIFIHLQFRYRGGVEKNIFFFKFHKILFLTGWPVKHGRLFLYKVTCPVYGTVHVYNGQVTFSKVPNKHLVFEHSLYRRLVIDVNNNLHPVRPSFLLLHSYRDVVLVRCWVSVLKPFARKSWKHARSRISAFIEGLGAL